MRTVAGIDLGTQSLKVVFYDYQAREIVASESADLDLYQRDDGTAEQQAHGWLNALHESLGRIDPSVRASARAVGVSGQQHGFVPLNRHGEVLAPVKLWCDTSTVSECDEIMLAFGGRQRCIDQLGNPIAAGYTASKILWLARHRPGLYENLECILLPHDYLNYYLTGEQAMEAGDASGTGLFDIRRRSWSSEMVAALDADRDLSSCLPDVRLDLGVMGVVTAQAAQSTGLTAGIPVSTGGGDNMMGAIGTGNASAGKVTISLGTSGTVYAYSDTPIVDPRGEIAAFCSSTGGWLPLLCTMNCTVTTELMRRMLDTRITEFEAQVEQAARGSDGVITLPFFNGERTPDLPRAKACVLGLDGRNTRPENLLRSAMEGATYALRYGMQRLNELGITTNEIRLTGGGSNSATWRQAVADICNTPVTLLEQNEGAPLGAALQALAVLENVDGSGIQALCDEHLTRNEALCCEPEESAVRFYNDAYQVYQDSVRAITPLYTG